MKLLTKEIKKRIPKIYETEKVPFKDKEVICKFFNPVGIGTWYVIEGQEEGDDFLFFGVVHLQEKELGYFFLSELESLTFKFDTKIERDMYFEQKKIKEIYCEGP